MLCVKKQGNSCVVYMDVEHDIPMSMSSFDDEPVGGFPKVLHTDAVLAEFGRAYDVKFLEASAPPPPESIPVDDAALEAFLAEENLAKEQQSNVIQLPKSAPQAAQTIPASDLGLHVITELNTMFAMRRVAMGKKKKELDVAIQAICGFLVRVYPPIKNQLLELSQKHAEEENTVF